MRAKGGSMNYKNVYEILPWGSCLSKLSSPYKQSDCQTWCQSRHGTETGRGMHQRGLTPLLLSASPSEATLQILSWVSGQH